MDSRLIDATGHSYGTKVDSQNRAWTFSTMAPLQHVESHLHGRAFAVGLIKYSDGATPWVTLTATGGPMMIINNKSTLNLILTRIMGALTGGANFWMHAFTSAVTPSANNRSLIARNLNFGKTDNTQVECFGWNGTGDGMTIDKTLSDSSQIAQLYVPGASGVDIEIADNWIIPPNAALVMFGRGIGGTPYCTFQILGYLHGDE